MSGALALRTAGGFLACAIVTSAPAASAEPLALDTLFSEEGHARSPSEVAFTDDGSRVSFLWSKEGRRDLYTMALAGDREPAVLLRAGELRAGEGEIDYKQYSWSPDGKALLLQTAGDLFHYRLADRALRRLTSAQVKSEDPRFSPDAKTVAFVRGADLWTVDVESGEERRLTHDGEEGKILNGKPDWLYWEEIWSRRSIGFWWSPDSRRIAYLRFDEEGVPTYPLVRDESVAAVVEHQPYPKPGERNPEVRVGVLDLATGETTWMKSASRSGDDYQARVRFTPKGESLAIVRLERDHTQAELLLCDPWSGECRSALVERLSTWVDVEDDFEILSDGRVLWGSDRDGWRRLYLHSANGEALHAVTPEGIAVTKLQRVVEATGELFFTGFRTAGLGAKDRQLYRVRLEGGEAEMLQPGCSSDTAPGWAAPGWAAPGTAANATGAAARRAMGDCDPARGTTTAEVAPAGGAWVVAHSTTGEPPRATLYRGGSPAEAVALPYQAPTTYDRAALPQWKFLTIPGPDGAALPARVLEPPGFDPTRRYPVLMFHYGGPASQTVEDASTERPSRELWHARMAQRGYVVVSADNPASVFFGKQGADRVHRRFGELELRAQLAVVEHLKAQPWVDARRIGLWGWSGGGTNTLYAVLRSPGTWRAAVAGAPVTDWRLYDSVWTERYLDSPADNADGYRDSSPITYAAQLADALLLVHGTADDNVHAQNTIMLTRELVKAGRHFEQAFYPDEKHGLSDTASRHCYERMEEFFDRWLMAG